MTSDRNRVLSPITCHSLIEIDDAFVGGRRSGKRGRGAEGKSPVLVAIENRDKRAGFIAMQQASIVTKESVAKFVQHHLPSGPEVRSKTQRITQAMKQAAR